jgi:hypothetical protein
MDFSDNRKNLENPNLKQQNPNNNQGKLKKKQYFIAWVFIFGFH